MRINLSFALNNYSIVGLLNSFMHYLELANSRSPKATSTAKPTINHKDGPETLTWMRSARGIMSGIESSMGSAVKVSA
jgi:hypothetical protein